MNWKKLSWALLIAAVVGGIAAVLVLYQPSFAEIREWLHIFLWSDRRHVHSHRATIGGFLSIFVFWAVIYALYRLIIRIRDGIHRQWKNHKR